MCEAFRGEERGKSAYAQTENDYPRECEEGEGRREADCAQQLRLSGSDTLSGPEEHRTGREECANQMRMKREIK